MNTTNANDVSLFNFGTNEIRVVAMPDTLWFVAADVCDALGLKADATNKSYQNHTRRTAQAKRP